MIVKEYGYELWLDRMLANGASDVWRVRNLLSQSPHKEADPLITESLRILDDLGERYATIQSYVQAVTGYPTQWRRERV